MLFIDKKNGFTIADTQRDPLSGPLPSMEEIQASYASMIISASGWRKIFAASQDPEDSREDITRADAYLVALIALSFARHMGRGATVLVGIDARPTGSGLADVVNRILLAQGVAVRYLFITAAPEIMAYSALDKVDGFFYISASHNPIGHNGFKFGYNGGVYSGAEAAPIINIFKSLVQDNKALALVRDLSASLEIGRYETVLEHCTEEKEKALLLYERLALTTACGSDDELHIATVLANLKRDIVHKPLGVVGELNGSARCVSIDRQLLAALGVRTRFLNDKPRQVVHPIVPEGENLEMCRLELEKAYAQDKAFQIGYVPDNDGDRGNIVYIRQSTGRAEILGAQELFALIAEIELLFAKNLSNQLAIAINGPTSLIIETIAAKLDVAVFRAEVGEANVVQLATQLREAGYTVRLLGEGSNGGNITHPCKVRDPLNTLFSLIKLLEDESLFRKIIALGTGAELPFTLEGAIDALPKRTITGSFSSEAIMHIKTTSHGALKGAYEAIFPASFDARREYLRNHFGISGWREEQTESTHCRIGVGKSFRSGQEKGGLKIVFLDAAGQATDFIWMRGSGTEPLFRVMADAQGIDQQRHDYLLDWQRSLVEQADAEATAHTEL
ncbi:MAG: phosphoglucomutase [Sphaerochaetaceae bacterium]